MFWLSYNSRYIRRDSHQRVAHEMCATCHAEWVIRIFLGQWWLLNRLCFGWPYSNPVLLCCVSSVEQAEYHYIAVPFALHGLSHQQQVKDICDYYTRFRYEMPGIWVTGSIILEDCVSRDCCIDSLDRICCISYCVNVEKMFRAHNLRPPLYTTIRIT